MGTGQEGNHDNERRPRQAWKEAKEMKEDLIDALKANLGAMADSDYHIRAAYA